VSWSLIQMLDQYENLWESPAQAAVMYWLCYKAHDLENNTKVAEVTAQYIARRSGLSKYRVRNVYKELEAMRAMTRIGDLKDGKKNRIIVHLERLISTQGAMRASAQFSDTLTAGDQGGHLLTITAGDHPPTPPAITPLTAGGEGAPPQTVDKKTYVQEATATAAASLSLPLFPLPPQPKPHERDVAAANQIRLARLRDRVKGLVRSLLHNPALGRELLHGEDCDASIGALYSATKLLCARKRVPGYADVAHGVCVSEYFKFRNRAVINGTAPRPRDRARHARGSG
jgi:hypothetical protein